ncbi:hypothetical protein PsYK624_122310 [Phanerochaete sordida]|uniref:F-box domain-containing protein n=1 Tax=Phanerochaete sordida TaxID=48140 RepID=A0A9P3GJF1_9APHY|nr:hypothetical protein PsYK624_122310 [Phanerochaete sordida]
MHVIPLELQDHVLDSLRGDRNALVDCALVCRAWRRRARFNLFHTLNIDWQSRRRTKLLLEILLEAHGSLRELTFSHAANLQPEELIGLLEALENLQSLSILAHTRQSGLLGLMLTITAHPVLGERLLLAIARMERLRVLDFTPRGFLYTSGPGPRSHDGPVLAVSGLRALRSLDGDMLPAHRMHRLWTALAAAKAHEGAAPLDHLGTAVHSLQPLAGFMRSVGSHLRTLRLDLRTVFFWEKDTASGFRESGLVLTQCKNLRALTLYLEAPSARDNGNIDVCAALLSTANTEDVPLAHIHIILYHLSHKFFAIPGLAEAVGALDENIVALPHLKRVDWDLAHCVVDDRGDSTDSKDLLFTMFCELVPQLDSQTKGIQLHWTGDLEPMKHPRIENA